MMTDNIGDFNICGVYRKTDDGFIVKALGHNRFSERKEEIPEGATFEELSERQRNYFCRSPVPMPVLDGLELGDWIRETKIYHLRIIDVMNLRPGQQIKVLVMDRNLYDIVCKDGTGNTLFPAEEFFKSNTAVYTHSYDMKGTIKYSWQDEPCNRNDPECKDPYPFEFEIEYAPRSWYPLTDNCLPARDPQEIALFDHDEPKRWTDFPQNTRVGWRGPMMKWEDVVVQENVFWHDETPN